MIVDDMPIFLEYLRGCIDWSFYGFEICCEAHNGKEALEQIANYYPDVVLTDITMPYMDGIELAEQIKIQYPSISVILITGNSEFEYARKAVKIGVCDYIVKPFEKEELLLSLLKLQDNVNRVLEMKTRKEEESHRKKEHLLQHLLFKKDAIQEDELKRVGITFCSEYYLIAVMKIKFDTFKDVETIINWETILIDMIKGMLVIDGSYEIIRDLENNLVVIMNFKEEAGMKSYKVYELQDLIKILKGQLHLECVIGISDFCYQQKNIRRSYAHVLSMVHRSNEGCNQVLDERKLAKDREKTISSFGTIEKLNESLKSLNEEEAVQFIETEWSRIDPLLDDTIKINFMTGAVSVLMTNIIHSGRNIEHIFGKRFEPYEQFRQIDSWQERKDMLIGLYKTRIQYEKNGSNKRYKEVSDAAKKYIEINYKNPDLTITDISKELLLNQTYLRKMFKNETNMTLTEYITTYRMQIAKNLILETDYKLTRIAEEVGYNDISYFSKCFKKHYGVSPKSISSKHIM